MLLVSFGGLIEVFVEHGCRGCRTVFAAWRRICGFDCLLMYLLKGGKRLKDEKDFRSFCTRNTEIMGK